MKDFMLGLHNEIKESKFYLSINIVHFTEENPSAEFEDWFCKSVTVGGPSIEIKNKTTHEKLWTIYNNMCRIGAEITSVMSKGQNQITAAIKQKTQEWIPSGEELDSLEQDKLMKVADYVEFYIDNPDIRLEKELIWPVDPDLEYAEKNE